MLQKLKNTLKHSAIYSLGNLSSKLVGFILLPIYFHYLTVEEYGILSIFEVTSIILIEVFLLSIPTAMLRWCASEKDQYKRKSIIFTSFFFVIIIAVFFSILLIPFGSNLSNLFFKSSVYEVHFKILIIYVSLSLISRLILSLFRLNEKSLFFVIASLARFSTVLLVNIYFITVLKWGVKGVLSGMLIGQVVLIFISIPTVIKNMCFKIELETLKEMMKYGFPLIFSTLSTMFLTIGDRYIIKFLIGDAAVGIYSAGFKIASLINVFVNQPFQMGFLPIAFKVRNEEGAERFYSKVLTYLVLVLAFFVINVTFYGEIIIKIISTKKEYLTAINYIPFIAFVFILKGVQYILSLGFHHIKQTKYNAYIVFLGATVSLIMNFLLVSQYKIFGAIISMNFSMMLMICITYLIIQKKYYIPYENSKIIVLIMLTVIYVFINEIINYSVLLNLTLKTILVFLLPVILYFIGFFEKRELDTISRIWREILKMIKIVK